MQLVSAFLKKYQDAQNTTADQAALAKFHTANEQCGSWTLQLKDLREEMLYSCFRKHVYQFLYKGSFNLEPVIPDDHLAILAESDLVGPGASVGAHGYDFYTKMYSSPLSCTKPFMYETYMRYVAKFPDMQEAELIRQLHYGPGTVVEGNRLSFVPKTYDCSRSICTEPSLNMMFQKGLGNILEKRLKQYFGIDLECQQAKNRELARMGSITGEWVTIDLSSASDTIGMSMLRECLPKTGLIRLLEVYRSPTTTISNGPRISLNMVSTMGNGFTFPLQTMLFSCVVAACAEVLGYPSRDFQRPHGGHLGTFGVNGDDIVCRREIAHGVLDLLKLLGFTVNKTKSFIEGNFRESCGGDYYYGHPVRGVYCKTLAEPSSRYSTINALNSWSARHRICLRQTVQLLVRTVRYLPVPPWEDDAAGIKVPWSMVEKLRRCKKTRSVQYARLSFVPAKLRIKDCEIIVPRQARERIYNPAGLLCSILHGAVRGGGSNPTDLGTITIRHDSGRFRTKIGLAPNWERQRSLPESPAVVPYEGEALRAWEHAVWTNVSR